jgi:diguanylate cyclase (GGDEF)-like protein/PAS domain S-box-containing protein
MAHDGHKLAPELRVLLDGSPDAVLIVDRTGAIVALNRRAETLFATTARRLRGKPVEALLPERFRGAHARARAAYTAAPTVRAMSARSGLMGLRADGSEFPVEVSLTPVAGSAEGLVMAVVHEVGARARIEAAITRTGTATEALDAIPDAIFTTDAAGNLDFLNQSAEELTGQRLASVRGQPLAEVLPLTSESSGEPLPSPVTECLRNRAPSGPCEALLPARSGHESRALDISATPIRDSSGAITGAAVVARDVTHARLIARELSHQATHDALTGLVNRSEFERRLARVVSSAAGDHGEHAVCFLDLDGFKRVNDACGHLAGDEMLRQLSDLMRDRMRSRDTLARVGGDEFGLLLEHCGLPKATRIADEIRKAISAYHFTFGEGTYGVGASIGIVPIRAGGRPTEVLRAADTACYLAKRAGGNRIHVHDPRQRAARTLRDRDWVRRVLRATEEDRFRLHAQALVPLDRQNGRVPRLELLLRLEGGGGELIPPNAFLPTARRHGLMSSVDGWVIRRAVRRLSEWQRTHPGVKLPALAINLADETVVEGKVVALTRAALAGVDVPPDALCFEITESVVVAHPAASADLLRGLRAAGCRTTLEHCGSGMAAFTLLRGLQVDYLKIAGHIVRSLPRDPVNRALATALNEVGHILGLRTIGAEAEDLEVIACLRRVGVDFAQGFGVGRPEPFDDAIERLGAPAGSAREPRPIAKP